MSQIATIAMLTQFINAQPANRQVDNTSFNSCIVGDFAREVLNHEIPVPIDDDYTAITKDIVIASLYKDSGASAHEDDAADYDLVHQEEYTLMDCLNEIEDGFPTYGDAQRWIRETAAAAENA